MKKMRNNEQVYIKTFYPKEVLNQAIGDYKKIAKIKLLEDDEYYKCEFLRCAVDTQLVINEFNNYLIELLNSKGESTGI